MKLSKRVGTYTVTVSGHSKVLCTGPEGVKGRRYDLYVDTENGDLLYKRVD